MRTQIPRVLTRPTLRVKGSSSPRRLALALVALAGLILGPGPCADRPLIGVPLPDQLSLVGAVELRGLLPGRALLSTLVVTLDGADVTAQVAVAGRQYHGTLDVATPGPHELSVSVSVVGGEIHEAIRSFETIDVAHPDECELFNAAECLLPYPSSRFLTRAETATGFQLAIPQVGMPTVNGSFSAAPYNQLDGFSPTVQILMHFPQGVDLEQSDASRLLPTGCCGQPEGPPWIDTRTYDGRSLEADSPSVLLDAKTGERILHFLEPDANAAGSLERQVLIMRPGRSLRPGHRYIVAVRGLVNASGSAVAAEPAFAALRDRRPTTIPGLLERKHAMEKLFAALKREGIGRDDLVLAFDFVVRSDHQLTHQALSMRDQAFAHLANVESDPGATGFSVDSVIENDCSQTWQRVWREVRGTFESPLFLTGDPEAEWVQFLNLDADAEPVQNGFITAPFSIAVPCSVVDPSAPLPRPVLLGAGAGGTGADIVHSFPGIVGRYGDQTSFIGGATEWRTLTNPTGLAALLTNAIGVGTSRLDNFRAVPDRLRQEVLNALVLGHLMKRGLFNRDPAFHTPDARGVFPGPSADLYYRGYSLGGNLGLVVTALSPDVERAWLRAPAVLLPWYTRRNPSWPFVALAISSIGLSDPMQTAVGVGLLHELAVTGDAAGYLGHVTRDPLPGATKPKAVLMSVNWLDRSAQNLFTELAARSLGLASTQGSIQQGLQEIPDGVGSLTSGLTIFDSGSFDVGDPAFDSVLPPLENLPPTATCDPHNQPVAAQPFQLVEFLDSGRVESFCDGLCDAESAIEQPTGTQCDPLGRARPVTLQNATTRLVVNGGSARSGLVPLDGFFRYTDRGTNQETTASIDPLLVFPDGRTWVLSDASDGGFGNPADLGGVVRSTAATSAVTVTADTELLGTTARTTFRFESAQPLDGTTFVFHADSDLFGFEGGHDDAAFFTGSVAARDLELFQAQSLAGGFTVRLSGSASEGAQLASFGAGSWPYFQIALEDDGDLSVLSADGSNFEATGGAGGLALAIAFDLSGSAATVVVEYGTPPAG